MATRNTVNNTYLTQPDVVNQPGGTNTNVQYNKNGAFAGDNGLRYNDSTKELTVQGNINVGGWIKGKIYTNAHNFFLTGGNANQVLSTDGTGNLSWIDQTGGGSGNYSNSNVSAYLATFTGNVAAGNIKTDNLLYANGVAWNLAGTYSNANVATYLPTYTGNITGGNVTVTGQLRGNTVYVTSTGTAINASQGNILTNEVTGTKLNLMSGLYTASITSGATSNYTLTLPTTAGTNGQVLTTNGSGALSWNTVTSGNISNISNGSSTVNIPTANGNVVINSAPTSNIELTTASLESVGAPCYIGNTGQFNANTEDNDDITVVDTGWTVVVDATTYTVSSIEPSPPANQFRINVPGATFVTGTTYTFTNPVPVEATWTIDQYGTLTTPAGGTINHLNDDFKIEVTGTDIIDLRTEGGDFILDAEGNININGPINSTTGVASLNLTGGEAYLTSTDDNTTALRMNTTQVDIYAGVDVNITSGINLPGLETDYIDSVVVLDDAFTQNSEEAGYPWGITLPVSYLTYDELIELSPGTFPNQTAVTTIANNVQNNYELWQDTIAQSNVRITANELNWTFDGTGALTLPGALLTDGFISLNPSSGHTLINISPEPESWAFLQLPNDDTANTANTRLWNAAGNVEIGAGDFSNSGDGYSWYFGKDGNLTLPGNTSSINYANGSPYGGSANTGNVTFDDITIQGGYQLNLSASPDDTANLKYLQVRSGVIDSHIHFDTGNNNAYDQYFGDDNKYLKLANTGNVTISAYQDGGPNAQFNFAYDGKLILPGDIESVTTGFAFTSNITDVDTTTTPGVVFIVLADSVFDGPESGQVTITDVVGTTEANGTWYFESADNAVFQLFNDEALQSPVDGTSWAAYISGGLAVAAGYNDLGIIGSNVAITTNSGETWIFDNTGSTIFPTLDTARGDITSGTISGSTLRIGDGQLEAIITTPDGDNDDNSSQRLVINPGKGADGTSGEGGDIYLWAGRGGDTGGSGGDIKIRGGQGMGTSGDGGYIRMEAGDGSNDSGYPGYIEINGGAGGTSQPGGYVRISGGYGDTAGGDANITAGTGSNGPGGHINLETGGSGLGLADYGNLYIRTGISAWVFDSSGNLTLPTISLGESLDEQTVIQSQRKIIPPFRYSVLIVGTTPTVVYTAEFGTVSLKSTITVQHQGAGFEMFDVSAVASGGDVIYSVGNRLNGTGQPDTSVSVDWVGSGPQALTITLTVNSGAETSWVTYDTTEFGVAVD